MKTITVKPTLHRGVLMRSYTEARAAKEFERLGLRWLYEPEAFLVDGVQYTPDFYLPDIDTIAEIKPAIFEGEVKRARSVIEKLGKTFVVLDPQMDGFVILDMFGPLQGCDPWAAPTAKCSNVGSNSCEMGWHSDAREDREMSFDDSGGRFDRPRFYMGAGCFWRWKNGRDCPCTN